jgi:hypothetical protein
VPGSADSKRKPEGLVRSDIVDAGRTAVPTLKKVFSPRPFPKPNPATG